MQHHIMMEGMEAYDEGMELCDNPYPPSNPKFTAWEMGWYSAHANDGPLHANW